MSAPSQQQKDGPARVPGWFQVAWALSMLVVINQLWWIRNIALVCWVRGWDAYFRDGVRVLPGKPVRFSTGELAPQFPDMVTGFGYFIIVGGSVTALFVVGLKVYERCRKGRPAS